jgi:thioredoxin-related protein
MNTKKLLIWTLVLSVLFAACTKNNNDDDNDTTDKNETIVTYNDISFSLTANSSEYGRMFSTVTGKIYKDSEITVENGGKIDLVFVSSNGTYNYFESPSLFKSVTIPNATSTKIQNLTTTMTVEEFDAMTDAENLKSLTITYDEESFGGSGYPKIILFENAAGKKGAIKVKSRNADVMIVDIKVQK